MRAQQLLLLRGRNGRALDRADPPAGGPIADDLELEADIDVHVQRPLPWVASALRVLVLVADAAALFVATQVLGDTGAVGLTYAALVVGVFAVTGGYRFRVSPRLGSELWGIVARLAIPLTVFPLLASGTSMGRLAGALPEIVLLVVFGREIAYLALRAARRKGLVVEPVLIIGGGNLGATIASTLYRHPEYGLRPVGFIDGGDALTPFPAVLGTIDDLDHVLDEYAVKRVIVAFSASRESSLVPVLRTCVRRKVDVYITPRFFELGVTQQGGTTEDIWGVPLVRLQGAAFRPMARYVKRAFDLVVASVALLLVSPLLVVAVLGTKLTSRGPVLFHQQRVGQDGRPIEVLKLRTLPPGSDPDTTWSANGHGDIPVFARFLRRTSIDELPQLFNVLRGDMSIVGPRPERPYFFEQFAAEVHDYGDRQRVPVGITGWAQVHGLRGDTSIEERARFDNHYIEHWSLWFDIVICFRTIRAMFAPHD